MNNIHILFFVCLGFHCVFCAPTASVKSLYDVIAEKCPSVHSIPTYKNYQIFKSCKDWKTISEVDKLTENNKKDILCLLYFESFTQYCTHTQKPNTNVPTEVLIKDNVDMICDQVKKITHKNLSKIFTSDDNCKTICTDDMGFVNSVCSISYYFAQPSLQPNSNKEEKEEKSHDAPDTDHAVPPEASKSEVNTEKKQVHQGSAPKPDNSPVVRPNVPEAVQNPDESNVNPDVKKPAIPAIPAEPKPDEPTPDPAAKPKTSADEVNAVHPAEEPNPVKADEVNAAPKASKPVETADIPPKQENGLESQVKPADTADAENQANVGKVDQGLAPETDQEVQPDDLAQQKEQSEQMPDNVDLENMDDDVISDGQDEKLETNANAAQSEKSSKPLKVEDSEPGSYTTDMEGDSYFFTYFMLLCIIFIVGYVCYHNKQKILALVLEGRKGRRQYRGRRPNSANYHKLDSNLEEAITSSCKKNTSNVIY